jgi:hypothetical protein
VGLARACLVHTARLIQAQLEGAYGDKDTRLPSYLKPPAHWSGRTDEQIEGD